FATESRWAWSQGGSAFRVGVDLGDQLAVFFEQSNPQDIRTAANLAVLHIGLRSACGGVNTRVVSLPACRAVVPGIESHDRRQGSVGPEGVVVPPRSSVIF